jgi:tetratricopeptide (TPR) repeat protein
MTCPKCGAATPPGAAFCATCGAPQKASGVVTGVLTPPGADLTPAGADVTGFEFDQTIGIVPAPHTVHTTPDAFDATLAQPAGARTLTSAFAGTTAGNSMTVTGGGPRQSSMFGPGQTIGTRYHIIRLLGVGGMGAVYHAWDAELGVAVALKVIRADIGGDPEATAAIERQFKRELLLARQVTHKHVVRIHDLGDVDGVKYITMPYVQGADLATVLKQAGKLEIARALRYVIQIVDGLVAAHEAGVVHRDLKPANVMIDEEDQALIMDFGIARSSNTAAGVSQVVGTLAYMAPEQAQAKPTDQRADVYALGMMFREMLIGRSGGEGQQAVAELMQRIKEAPPRVRAVDPQVPEPLDDLIAKCVEPDPANRYATSAELAHALAALDENGHLRPAEAAAARLLTTWRMATAAAVVVALLGVGALFLRRGPAAAPKPIDPVSILVADFDNKTGDPAFDGALEPSLTFAMEGASFITNYSRPAALKLAQTLGNATKLDAAAARPVAFREGVKYVLAGSVAATGGKFQLQVDALDPESGKAVKSATATASSKEGVLSAVGTLASKLRTGLGDKSASAQPAAAETFTAGSIDAMREYGIAQDLQYAGESEKALAAYQRAIALDPKFGRAYSGAATATFRLGRREEADAFSKQALALMDRMTEREKFRTLGSYYLDIAANYDRAAENYAALVKAYPNDTGGHANLALAYFYLLDFPKALAEGKAAVETDPKNVIAKYNQALYAMYAADFAGGAALGKAVSAQSPAIVKAYLPVAVAAAVTGDAAAALAAYDDMTAKAGAAGASLAAIGRADLALYTGSGNTVPADLKASIAEDLTAKRTTPAAVKQIAIAEAELAAGRKAQAIDAAHEALTLTKQAATIVPAARVLMKAGKIAEARALAGELEGQLQKQSRAYGKIVLAEIALEEKKPAEAVDLLTQARALADLWLGRFDLGVAYVMADPLQHGAEAIAELETAQKRRGEATALFFDDRPTVRYLATLPYWLGRAQEGLSQAAPARASYESFLKIRGEAAADPLVQDARKRLAAH